MRKGLVNPISSALRRHTSRKWAKQITWKEIIRSLFVFIFAVMILIFLKQAEDGSAAPENTEQKEYFKIFSPDFIYEWMIGAPEPPAQYISIVIVGKDSGSAIMNSAESGGKTVAEPCERRSYIAHLLNALASSEPRVIVLDVWFDPEMCSEQNSQPLWDVLDSVSKRIPVITGIGSYNLSEVVSGWPAELAAIGRKRSMLAPTELVSMPAINPIRSSSGPIIQAVVEFDLDSRKIPLSWPVYHHFATITNGAKADRIDSLSVAAVRAFNPRDQILKRLAALDSTNLPVASTSMPPYTSFLREEDLPIFRADDIICSGVAVEDSLRNCSAIGATTLDLKSVITGRVVLVGLAGFGSDVHKSVIGNVPGVVLHANYVESLLQDRVYPPLSIFSQALIWLVWLIILFAIPRFASQPYSIVGWHLIAVVVLAVLMRLFISSFKHYTPLVFPVVLAAAFLLVSRTTEAVLEKHGETK